MVKEIKITVIKTDFYEDIAKKYAVPELTSCLLHKEGQIFYSDGKSMPKGLCEYAWNVLKPFAETLIAGELLQPQNSWMIDDTKAVIACPDGVRPVIMLIERKDHRSKN